jgi:hypothetical protein
MIRFVLVIPEEADVVRAARTRDLLQDLRFQSKKPD